MDRELQNTRLIGKGDFITCIHLGSKKYKCKSDVVNCNIHYINREDHQYQFYLYFLISIFTLMKYSYAINLTFSGSC